MVVAGIFGYAQARSADFDTIAAIARRALELEAIFERTEGTGDINRAKAAHEELLRELLPRARQLTLETRFHTAFSHFACGLVFRVLGMTEQAVEEYRKSLSRSPNTLNTLLEITRCLGELGDFHEAKKHAQHAVEVDHSSPQAWGNLAMTLIHLRDEEPAHRALRKALELAPEDEINRTIELAFKRVFGQLIKKLMFPRCHIAIARPVV